MTRQETTMWTKQREIRLWRWRPEGGSHKPWHAGSHQNLEKARNGFSITAPEGQQPGQHLGFCYWPHTSGLQNSERINFSCCKPTSWWSFVKQLWDPHTATPHTATWSNPPLSLFQARLQSQPLQSLISLLLSPRMLPSTLASASKSQLLPRPQSS